MPVTGRVIGGNSPPSFTFDAALIARVKAWLVRVETGIVNDPPGPLGRA